MVDNHNNMNNPQGLALPTVFQVSRKPTHSGLPPPPSISNAVQQQQEQPVTLVHGIPMIGPNQTILNTVRGILHNVPLTTDAMMRKEFQDHQQHERDNEEQPRKKRKYSKRITDTVNAASGIPQKTVPANLMKPVQLRERLRSKSQGVDIPNDRRFQFQFDDSTLLRDLLNRIKETDIKISSLDTLNKIEDAFKLLFEKPEPKEISSNTVTKLERDPENPDSELITTVTTTVKSTAKPILRFTISQALQFWKVYHRAFSRSSGRDSPDFLYQKRSLCCSFKVNGFEKIQREKILNRRELEESFRLQGRTDVSIRRKKKMGTLNGGYENCEVKYYMHFHKTQEDGYGGTGVIYFERVNNNVHSHPYDDAIVRKCKIDQMVMLDGQSRHFQQNIPSNTSAPAILSTTSNEPPKQSKNSTSEQPKKPKVEQSLQMMEQEMAPPRRFMNHPYVNFTGVIYPSGIHSNGGAEIGSTVNHPHQQPPQTVEGMDEDDEDDDDEEFHTPDQEVEDANDHNGHNHYHGMNYVLNR